MGTKTMTSTLVIRTTGKDDQLNIGFREFCAQIALFDSVIFKRRNMEQQQKIQAENFHYHSVWWCCIFS